MQRVLWAEEIPPHVQVSGHVYDVETGLVTTIVDAKASRQPAYPGITNMEQTGRLAR